MIDNTKGSNDRTFKCQFNYNLFRLAMIVIENENQLHLDFFKFSIYQFIENEENILIILYHQITTITFF